MIKANKSRGMLMNVIRHVISNDYLGHGKQSRLKMCTEYYDLCNWICDSYDSLVTTVFHGCSTIDVYVENARSAVAWTAIPKNVHAIEVRNFTRGGYK